MNEIWEVLLVGVKGAITIIIATIFLASLPLAALGRLLMLSSAGARWAFDWVQAWNPVRPGIFDWESR